MKSQTMVMKVLQFTVLTVSIKHTFRLDECIPYHKLPKCPREAEMS